MPIDRSYFGAVERGEFNVTIVTVAHGLNLTVAELLKVVRVTHPIVRQDSRRYHERVF